MKNAVWEKTIEQYKKGEITLNDLHKYFAEVFREQGGWTKQQAAEITKVLMGRE